MSEALLVTGASSGVGLSLVRHLCRRFEVVAVARRLDRLETAFAGERNVVVRQADLSQPAPVAQLTDWLLARYSHVPYVINNAGVNLAGPMDTLALEDVSRSVMVNALAPFMILKALLPGMKAKNFGRVVNITSGAPFNCFPGYGAYSASKAMLNALTITVAKECAGYDIRINLMSPGPVRTEMAPTATMDPAVCHPTVDYLLGLDAQGPTGRFFWLGYEIPLFPDLAGIDWLAGTATAKFKRVVEPPP